MSIPPGYPISPSIVRILVNRLRFEEILQRHSAILDEKIVTPLFIIGPGRVGSTKLHRLLATATIVHSTPLWQVMHPIPFPHTDPAGPAPRIAAPQPFCNALRAKQPPSFAPLATDALPPPPHL